MKDKAIDQMNELKAPEMMDEIDFGGRFGLLDALLPARKEVINQLWEEHKALREYARRVSQSGTNQDV